MEGRQEVTSSAARRPALARIARLVLVACVLPAPREAEPPGRRPNIVVFLADDVGYADLAAFHADSRIPTPTIDRLAREGMRFTDAHAPASVCTPTRYALLTGRYPWRGRLTSGVLRFFDEPLVEPRRLTLPALLRAHGYATAAIGKWHLGLDVRRSSGDGWARSEGPLPPADVNFARPVEGGPLDC